MSTHNPHDGHRDRMREKFIQNGLGIFEDHEILEMLLFYSIPRKNTNELAHKLIDKFGSISKVFDANIDLLQEVDGISKNTAVLIKMVPAMLRIYTGEFSDSRISFKNEALVKELLTRLYAGVTTESIKVIFLDLNMRYIACESLCDSSNAYSVGIDPKKIVQRAEMHNCTNIVLTHNHPEDTCTPSSQDIRATLKMKEVFEGLNIVLVDHIIFSNLDNKIYSMRDKGHLRDRNRM